MYIIIGIALLLIIVVVLDCIRYKHSQRIKDAEHTQRYVTNKRNGWNDNTSSTIPETKFK